MLHIVSVRHRVQCTIETEKREIFFSFLQKACKRKIMHKDGLLPRWSTHIINNDLNGHIERFAKTRKFGCHTELMSVERFTRYGRKIMSKVNTNKFHASDVFEITRISCERQALQHRRQVLTNWHLSLIATFDNYNERIFCQLASAADAARLRWQLSTIINSKFRRLHQCQSPHWCR